MNGRSISDTYCVACCRLLPPNMITAGFSIKSCIFHSCTGWTSKLNMISRSIFDYLNSYFNSYFSSSTRDSVTVHALQFLLSLSFSMPPLGVKDLQPWASPTPNLKNQILQMTNPQRLGKVNKLMTGKSDGQLGPFELRQSARKNRRSNTAEQQAYTATWQYWTIM